MNNQLIKVLLFVILMVAFIIVLPVAGAMIGCYPISIASIAAFFIVWMALCYHRG